MPDRRRPTPLDIIRQDLEEARRDYKRRCELANSSSPGELTYLWVLMWKLIVDNSQSELERMEIDIKNLILDAEGRPKIRPQRQIVEGRDMKDQFVLIVEPEPFIRLDVSTTVEDMGYQVREVRTGEEALGYLEGSVKPDLIITAASTDCEINGHRLIEHARRKWPSIPAIILSAGDDDPSLRDPRTFLVQKPFSTNTIEQSVQEALAAAGSRDGSSEP